MVQLAALEAAMGEMEAARATFEAKACRVSDELAALQQQVVESNLAIARERQAIIGEERKRRRLSGDRTPAAPAPNPDAEAEGAFERSADEVAERLQTARRAMARAHNETLRVRAGVDAAKAAAAPLCSAGRFADAKEARNEECSELVKGLGFVTARGANHEAVLGFFSVVGLWRMRRVSRSFRRWCTAKLSSLPRVAAVGGHVRTEDDIYNTAGVEVLDLSTLRWSSAVVPALPGPRDQHALVGFAKDGRVVVAGGDEDDTYQTAAQWVRGAQAWWAPLPDLAETRVGMAAVALPDGRAMVIGGGNYDGQVLASVEVLAADGSGWSALAPMRTERCDPAAVVLPCGKVLVAGGSTTWNDDGHDDDSARKTAELWDPATGAWSDLPPMGEERSNTGCCVLPSGRVAVVGGGNNNSRAKNDGEAFDPEAQTWQPLPPMARYRQGHGVVAVAGGLLALGGSTDDGPDELFDEASGRWFELPHPMAEPRKYARVLSLPKKALMVPPPGAAAGNAGAATAAARAVAPAAP